MPLTVTLDVTSGRLEPTVESETYFVACEAMTNAAKHADASSLRVCVGALPDRLLVEVLDDGGGGAAASPGGGLAGLQDRVAALGGSLTVDSPHGSGTRITASIPCG